MLQIQHFLYSLPGKRNSNHSNIEDCMKVDKLQRQAANSEKLLSRSVIRCQNVKHVETANVGTERSARDVAAVALD